LPPSLQYWVLQNHRGHFVIAAVEQPDLCRADHEQDSGSEQHPPATMLALLVYSYATGTFASRRIKQSSFDNVAVRYLCADTHPAPTLAARSAGKTARCSPMPSRRSSS